MKNKHRRRRCSSSLRSDFEFKSSRVKATTMTEDAAAEEQRRDAAPDNNDTETGETRRAPRAQIPRDSIFLIQISCGNSSFRLLAGLTRNYSPNVNGERETIVTDYGPELKTFKGTRQPRRDSELQDRKLKKVNEVRKQSSVPLFLQFFFFRCFLSGLSLVNFQFGGFSQFRLSRYILIFSSLLFDLPHRGTWDPASFFFFFGFAFLLEKRRTLKAKLEEIAKLRVYPSRFLWRLNVDARVIESESPTYRVSHLKRNIV